MPLTPLITGIMIFEKDEPTMRFAINIILYINYKQNIVLKTLTEI